MFIELYIWLAVFTVGAAGTMYHLFKHNQDLLQDEISKSYEPEEKKSAYYIMASWEENMK